MVLKERGKLLFGLLEVFGISAAMARAKDLLDGWMDQYTSAKDVDSPYTRSSFFRS